MQPRILRVASGQGFWGDDLEAPIRQVENGPIDYLMLDYLAEVTMSVLQKLRARDPGHGFARDFIPLMERIFATCVERGISVVTNAGGVNPSACTDEVLRVGREAGVAGRARVGTVLGDDLMERLDNTLLAEGHDLCNMDTGAPCAGIRERVRAANVYFGAEPIVRALGLGANSVVTGRAADAALAYAPMIHEFEWRWDDWDRLAAGVVAGHIIECGAQSSGGNCLVDWWSIPNLAEIGFPIVEVSPDGSFVVTKHDGSGGRVDRATVTEQIVYEIGDPRAYITPDVVADFTTIELEYGGSDRVLVGRVRGRAATDFLKVSIAYSAGFKAVGTLTYAWPDAAAKARLAARTLAARLERLGLDLELRADLVGWDSTHGPLAGEPPPDLPEVQLRVAVRGQRRSAVERFTREVAPLVLTGPPTVTGYAGGRPRVEEIVAFWPALIRGEVVEPHLTVEVVDA